MKNRALALSASAAFALLLVGSPASADTVSIALQEAGVNGGAITAVGTTGTSADFHRQLRHIHNGSDRGVGQRCTRLANYSE